MWGIANTITIKVTFLSLLGITRAKYSLHFIRTWSTCTSIWCTYVWWIYSKYMYKKNVGISMIAIVIPLSTVIYIALHTMKHQHNPLPMPMCAFLLLERNNSLEAAFSSTSWKREFMLCDWKQPHSNFHHVTALTAVLCFFFLSCWKEEEEGRKPHKCKKGESLFFPLSHTQFEDNFCW